MEAPIQQRIEDKLRASLTVEYFVSYTKRLDYSY